MPCVLSVPALRVAAFADGVFYFTTSGFSHIVFAADRNHNLIRIASMRAPVTFIVPSKRGTLIVLNNNQVHILHTIRNPQLVAQYTATIVAVCSIPQGAAFATRYIVRTANFATHAVDPVLFTDTPIDTIAVYPIQSQTPPADDYTLLVAGTDEESNHYTITKTDGFIHTINHGPKDPYDSPIVIAGDTAAVWIANKLIFAEQPTLPNTLFRQCSGIIPKLSSILAILNNGSALTASPLGFHTHHKVAHPTHYSIHSPSWKWATPLPPAAHTIAFTLLLIAYRQQTTHHTDLRLKRLPQLHTDAIVRILQQLPWIHCLF